MKTEWQEEQCYDFIDRHPVLFLDELSEKQARLFMIEGSISDFLTGKFEDKFEYRVFYYAYRKYYGAKGIRIRVKRGRQVVRKFCYFQDFLEMRNRFQVNLDLFDFDKYPRMVRNAYRASCFSPSFRCFFVSEVFAWGLLAIVLAVAFLLCTWAIFS